MRQSQSRNLSKWSYALKLKMEKKEKYCPLSSPLPEYEAEAPKKTSPLSLAQTMCAPIYRTYIYGHKVSQLRSREPKVFQSANTFLLLSSTRLTLLLKKYFFIRNLAKLRNTFLDVGSYYKREFFFLSVDYCAFP